MGCDYTRDGVICLNMATEYRAHPLKESDTANLWFCDPHAETYDAIMWARRKAAECQPNTIS